jgi:hypothetical protein
MNRLTDDEKIAIFRTMSRYGGGFASAVAEAWLRADPYNRETIEKAFPDLVREYRDMAESRGEMPRG